MFGMLQYDSRDNDVKFIEKADASDVPQHSACDYCRRKKLRCSGDSTGCARCKALSRSCTYKEATQTKASRGRRRHTRSTTSPRPKTPPEMGIHMSTFDPTSMEDISGDSTSSNEPASGMQTQTQDQMDQPPLPPPSLQLGTNQALDDLGLLSGMDLTLNTSCDMLDSITPDFDALFSHFNPHQNPADVMAFSPLTTTQLAQLPPSPPQSLDPRTSSAISSQRPRSSCCCVETISFLLEELDGSVSTVDASPLDASLASNKGALATGQRLLRCPECTGESANLMLLAFVCEKLVTLCTKVVTRYTRHMQEQRASSEGGENLNIGEYEISSQREWGCLIRALIMLQLRNLGDFLAETMRVAANVLPSSQYTRLATQEEKVKELSTKIGN